MPTFSQRPAPDEVPKPQPRIPLSALIWFPLTIAIGFGIVQAARFGYRRASDELSARPNPAAANETLSAPFLIDPGDEPLIFARGQKALRDHLSAPPGSTGSGTLVESNPVRLRIIERDLDLARVVIVEGHHQGERYWTKADRLTEARAREEARSKDPN